MTDGNRSDMERALEQCATEPVHIPGTIQSNGAMIAVDNETLVINHASANLEAIVGLSHQTVLGQALQDVFPNGIRHDLVNGMLPPFLKQTTRNLDTLELGNRPLFCGASAAGGSTIFEFEPTEGVPPVSNSAVQQIAFLTAQLSGVESRDALFEKTVRLLQALTGYQRIMVYEFDQDGNGAVRAEALTGNLESYLGLNFPAWDIPEQARAIMLRTPIRYIGDVREEPVAVLAAHADLAPLDMTNSHLRGVSPIHVRYLANMGTYGSLTLNVVVDGKLWGMIAMHNPEPRIPEQKIRDVCRNFISYFSLTLEGILQRERLTRLHEAGQLRRELADSVKHGDGEGMFANRLLVRLTDAMESDGALLFKDGNIQSTGLTPPPEQIDAFVAYCKGCVDGMSSASLRTELPDVVGLVGDEIAGLHLTKMIENNFVVFFRRDRKNETIWAGAPDKPIVGTGADARLQPRGSFQAYKEIVSGSSLPWTAQNHQIASEVWTILVNAERTSLIEKTTRQQTMLINELNHRVRNILTLIRSLSRQSRSTAHTIDGFIETLESRIEAVANAHSLAVERPDSYVSIQTILKLEAAPHNAENARVVIAGEDMGLRPDVAPILALVVHELMTNAAKYGALSTQAGRVDITLAAQDSGLALHWIEAGGPKVEPPQRKGFGTNLLSNAVPSELHGSLDVTYHEAGVEVALTLPEELLSRIRYAPTPKQTPDMPHEIIGEEQRNQRATLRCLLVEDSFVISMDTMRIMNEVGLIKVQTAMNVPDAMTSIETEPLDFAVLDVNLSGGETSHSIADRLYELGVPFVFVTGYGSGGVPKDVFPDAAVLRKPLSKGELEPVLRELEL